MRLALISREFPPLTAYTGGIGRQASLLSAELARLGHEVHVVTVTLGDSEVTEHRGAAVHLLRRPNPTRLWFLEEPAWTVKVERYMSELGSFDVVFAPEWGGEAALYSRRQVAGPLVTELTTSLDQVLRIAPNWDRGRRMRIRHRIQGPLERFQTERSSAIMASSNAILHWARDLWNIEAIPSAVVPNMVEIEPVRNIAERGEPPAGFPTGRPLVVFAGRLEIRKGVHVLAEAMHEVWRRWPEAELAMLGADGDWEGGRMSDHLRRIAGRHAERLHVLGNHPQDRLYPALAAADVIALPSLWENFSLVALEAMAIGRPIVVTTGSGFDDFFNADEDSLMVPPGEVEPLAAALVRILESDELGSRLERGVAETVERYRPEPVAREHLALFERVVDAPSARPAGE